MFANEDYKIYTTGVYGVFDIFGGKFHDGTGWIPPDSFIPKDRPWYKAAAEANGKTAVTEPYLSVAMNVFTLTFARRIFNEEGRPLGIVCLDIVLDRVRELAINTRFAHSGYGILLNSQLEVLAHPNNEMCGKYLKDIENSFIPIAEDLKQGLPVLERRIINYKGEASVIFFRQIENDWYIAVMIPENAYFKEMRIMRLVIIVLGTVLAALFITLVQLLYNAQKKLQYYGVSKLTTREMEIFNLLLTDMPIKQIAEKTALTNAGVNFHIQNLYRKLGIQSRTELFAKFVNRPNSE